MSTPIKKRLREQIERLPVIDAHEHLLPEQYRLGLDVDVFSLFTEYAQEDLKTAGMRPEQLVIVNDTSCPPERRWEAFAPFWENIRYGSYARAILLSIERIYGFDDINAGNYDKISQAMRKNNTPGVYSRVLRDVCGIQKVINQCNMTNLDKSLFIPQMPMPFGHSRHDFPRPEKREDLAEPFFSRGAQVRSLDDYTDCVRQYIREVKEKGAVGLKMTCYPYAQPSRKDALEFFAGVMSKAIGYIPCVNPMKDYVVDEAVSYAGKLGLSIQVHTGYWHRYDFRLTNPLNMIPLLQRHENVRFDLYHLGLPWNLETLTIGKAFPNVFVNFCWAHILSQRGAENALRQALDLIPVNKLLLFGGDMEALQLENVYGHLAMARENIAAVLSDCVSEGRMSEDGALRVASLWLYDNAAGLYLTDR